MVVIVAGCAHVVVRCGRPSGIRILRTTVVARCGVVSIDVGVVGRGC